MPDSDAASLTARAAVFGAAAIFGGIHCAAWNALFPSLAEMWMWRMSSVVVAGYPFLTILLKLGADWEPLYFLDHLYSACIATGIVLYPLCRLVLMVLSFTTLRALSSGDFVDVDSLHSAAG
ncbi:hypothetical protein B0H16DRAFT_1892640 [Mycena metata]|uniref:Uncharacterized protein n=1 Tax=Mycena metata TaxID=1033252 RepID=A0AAD7MUV0_9AGAR|nr:hypothetical protein B0H16DRAFT_1892640 [Mycena metata]